MGPSRVRALVSIVILIAPLAPCYGAPEPFVEVQDPPVEADEDLLSVQQDEEDQIKKVLMCEVEKVTLPIAPTPIPDFLQQEVIANDPEKDRTNYYRQHPQVIPGESLLSDEELKEIYGKRGFSRGDHENPPIDELEPGKVYPRGSRVPLPELDPSEKRVEGDLREVDAIDTTGINEELDREEETIDKIRSKRANLQGRRYLLGLLSNDSNFHRFSPF